MSTDANDSSSSPDDNGKTELGELIEQVDADSGEDGAAAMADQLRGKTPETEGEPEAPGDLED
jgi:hypothetical protein